MTEKIALLGYPLEHSLSPVMHNAAYRDLGLPWRYQLLPCPTAARFSAEIARLRAADSGFIAANVTTPYKRQAFALADACLDQAVAQVGAANLLCFGARRGTLREGETDQISCANTDGQGIIAALHQAGVGLAESKVVICGSGAVATVASTELLRHELAALTVLSRDVSRAAQLLACLDKEQESCSTTLRALSYDNAAPVNAAIAAATVIIDATTVGTVPSAPAVIPTGQLHAGQTVLEVNYGHGASTLLREARERGAQALDGLTMLVEQAALSIEVWAAWQGSVVVAPRALMRGSALAELTRRGADPLPRLARAPASLAPKCNATDGCGGQNPGG